MVGGIVLRGCFLLTKELVEADSIEITASGDVEEMAKAIFVNFSLMFARVARDWNC